MSDRNYILAEFKGTYRAPHPDGIKDANVTKQFNVKVKMKRESLKAPGLCGLFATYYKELLKTVKDKEGNLVYRDMIDTYMYDLVQATELDGTVINNPKALSHERLISYIKEKEYPINALLYSSGELRNEVILYEEDPKGQQYLQNRRQKQKGHTLAISAEIQNLDDVIQVVGAEREPELAAAASKGKSKTHEVFA